MKHKKALITGANGKIGAAIAQTLLKDGAKLVLHCGRYNRDSRLRGNDTLCGNDTLFCADFRDVAQVRRLVKTAIEKLGSIDLLIHCVSVFRKTPFGNITEKVFDEIIAVDLKAAFFLAQEVAQVMGKKGGRMVFFSDTAAQDPYPGYLPYCMAKAGVDAMVKGLAKKLAPKISVNAIAPHLVTKPDEMVAKVIALMNKPVNYTGNIIKG